MPASTTRFAFFPVTLTLLNSTAPPSGLYNPVSTLKRVVLPAPLGPISPKISPGSIASDTVLRACRPPNDLLIFCASSRGIVLGVLYRAGRTCRGELAPARRRGPQPRGAQQHHQDQGQTEQ